jgi:CheY-like chemotaxis protein
LPTDEKIKILVVDDRTENLMAIEGVLEQPDLSIITATSGNEALGLVLEHSFALILLDVQMPGMDGFEVAELMRGSEKPATSPSFSSRPSAKTKPMSSLAMRKVRWTTCSNQSTR